MQKSKFVESLNFVISGTLHVSADVHSRSRGETSSAHEASKCTVTGERVGS